MLLITYRKNMKDSVIESLSEINGEIIYESEVIELIGFSVRDTQSGIRKISKVAGVISVHDSSKRKG